MKKRGRSQRANDQQAKRNEEKKRKRSVYIAIFLGIVSLFCAVVVLVTGSQTTFKEKNGEYTDLKTGVTYKPTDLSVYELRGEYLSDKPYGKMDGDPVYKIDGVSSKSWLIRKHGEDLYTLYYGENTVVPALSAFDSESILICTDGSVVSVEGKIEDLSDVEAIISHIGQAERVDRPDAVTVTYNLRFQSKEYPFLYYCVKYLENENGAFLYLYDEDAYVSAPTVIKSYVNGINE